MKSNQKLTTKAYWEQYYAHNHAQKKHIIHVCSAYDKYWDILIQQNAQNKSLIEIGGYPGRYLAYVGSRYNLNVTCLDYNSDTAQIKNCLKAMEVHNYELLVEDFTTYEPENQYDFLLSNGFIEHFENFDEILDLHVKYLKKNGRMLVMIPNMRGYIKFYKYLVDYKNLKIHNLKSMRKTVFESFAERNNLKVIHLSYFGGFPLNVHQKLNFLQKVIYKIHRLLFKNFLNSFIEKYPSSFYSSGIIGIFEKS